MGGCPAHRREQTGLLPPSFSLLMHHEVSLSDLVFTSGRKYSDEILTFLLNKFRIQEPITRSLEASAEDVFAFFTDLRNGGIEESVVAFRHDEESDTQVLVGICLNHLDPRPSSDPHPNEFDPFKDFKEDVDSGPYKERNANRLNAFIAAIEGDVHLTLGKPNLIFHVDVICVDVDYARNGIGAELLKRSVKIAKDEGADLLSTVATAQASQTLFRKEGFYTVRELPFSCFRENRIPIFRNLHDGGRSGLLMAFSLRSEDEDEDLR